MTSPIYPPQGGFSEVWRIKLSPEIKRLLAQFSHGGSCARSPYVFQSCCILFDIISVDQGILHSSQTYSPPKGNISLTNTDMIYADFSTCEILHKREHNFLQVLKMWGKRVQYTMRMLVCVCVQCVCGRYPRENTAYGFIHLPRVPMRAGNGSIQ